MAKKSPKKADKAEKHDFPEWREYRASAAAYDTLAVVYEKAWRDEIKAQERLEAARRAYLELPETYHTSRWRAFMQAVYERPHPVVTAYYAAVREAEEARRRTQSALDARQDAHRVLLPKEDAAFRVLATIS